MEEKKKEKGPLKKELQAELELSKTETIRVQEAYKTALDREKDLCLELEQAKVDRHSAVKELEKAEVALKEALAMGEEKSGEVDDFIKLISETEVKLDAANKRLASKTKEVERLTSQSENPKPAIPPEVLVERIDKPRPLFRVFSFCGAIAIVLCLALVGSIYLEVAPTAKEFIVSKISNREDLLAGVTFKNNPDGADMIGAYNNMPNRTIREPLLKWAKENKYDSILFGTILKWGGEEVLDIGTGTVPLRLIVKQMRALGHKTAISFAKNPDNITLPNPFVKTSQGEIEFWQNRHKMAGFIPTFWNGKKQVKFKSSSFSGIIKSGKAKVKFSDMTLETMYPVDAPKPTTWADGKNKLTD